MALLVNFLRQLLEYFGMPADEVRVSFYFVDVLLKWNSD